MLNEQLDWNDLRFAISRQASPYDSSLSFIGRPVKTALPTATRLYRLDPPVVFGIFNKAWWMPENVYQRLFASDPATASELRQAWQNAMSLAKPNGRANDAGQRRGEGAIRTRVTIIQLTQPVYAWLGPASPLFHKAGGEQQVYLPNLAKGHNGDRSDYARLIETATLAAL